MLDNALGVSAPPVDKNNAEAVTPKDTRYYFHLIH